MMNIIVDSYISKLGNTKINYLISVPKDYDKTKKYPLIIALSGDGAKAGAGIDRMRIEGMNNSIKNGLEIPFIVMSPQTPFADYETVDNNQFKPGVMSAEAVDIAASKYSIDLNKVYIFALSMSGPSVPLALAYFPNKFAAGISVGSWETESVEAPKIKGGILDIKSNNDPVGGGNDYNIQFIEAAKNAKEASYVVLPYGGHVGWSESTSNSWIGTKADAKYPGSKQPMNIYDWYLKFSLDNPVVVTPPVSTTASINLPVTLTPATIVSQTITIKNPTGAKININGVDYTGDVNIVVK